MIRLLGMLGLLLSLWVDVVGAQDSREAEAKAIFQAGKAAYDAGRYDDALARFKEAYRLSNRHELLYNIGQAADRARQDEEALAAFEAFLEKTPPTSAGRETAEARVAYLREQIAKKPAVTKVPTPAEAAAQAANTPSNAPPTTAGSPALAIGLVSGGVVLVAAAIVVGVIVASQPRYAQPTSTAGLILLQRSQP